MNTHIAGKVLRISIALFFILSLLPVPQLAVKAQGQETGEISGTVRDENGDPLSSKSVWISGYDDEGYFSSTSTNSIGEYRFSDVPEGGYILQVVDNCYSCEGGYATTVYDNVYDSRLATRVVVVAGQTTANIDIVMKHWGIITGFVRDVEGNPIESANVIAGTNYFQHSGRTQADGSYRFTATPVEYRISVQADGYADEYYNNTYLYPNAQMVTVFSNTETPSIDFTLEPGATISGVVLGDDLNPIADTYVCAYEYDTNGYGHCVRVNEDGTYTFPNLPPLDYRLSADSNLPGYPPTYYNGIMESSQAERFSVSVGSTFTGMDFTLYKEGSISGSVQDAFGNPIPNFRICATLEENRPVACGMTNASGSYTITGLYVGEWYLYTSFPETWRAVFYPDARGIAVAQSVPVSSGQNTPDINFVLEPGQPFPSFSVRLSGNEIHGYEWELGAPVTITVDDPATAKNPDYTDTQVAVDADWDSAINNTFVRFANFGDFTLQAGMEIIMTDGVSTKTHTVTKLVVTDVDPATDTITGTAGPNERVIVGWVCDENGCAIRYVNADGSGAWVADFSQVGTYNDEQTLFDIRPGTGSEAIQYDSDNDATSYGWYVPNPTFNVRVTDKRIDAWGWNLGANVTLTIDGSEISTQTVKVADWDPNQTFVWFDLSGFTLQAGQLIEMTDGNVTKTTIITTLAVTDVDMSADTVSGTADASSLVDVGQVCDITGCAFRRVIAELDSAWIADFSQVGEDGDEQTIYDIRAGTSSEARQCDQDGDCTVVNWYPKAFGAFPGHDRFELLGWPIGTNLTLKVYNPGTDIHDAPDFSTTVIVQPGESMSGDPAVPTVLSNQNMILGVQLSGIFDVKPGSYATVSDGQITRELYVYDLEVTRIDPNVEKIYGKGELNVPVDAGILCDETHCAFRRVMPGPDGTWEADYSQPGDELFENTTFDLYPGLGNESTQYEPDGDFTEFFWHIPNPSFSVRANEDRVEGWEWPNGTTVWVEIDDPATPGAPDYSETAYVQTTDWDPNQTLFNLDMGGVYDVKPGDIVTVSDGTTTKQHMVSSLEFTFVDVNNDIVYGIAIPDSQVNVWACDNNNCFNRHEMADGDGNWSANFAVPGDEGDEQNTFDIQSGTWIDSSQWDEDGDSTQYGLNIFTPWIDVRLDENRIDAWDWPNGTFVNLEIDDPNTPETPDFSTHYTIDEYDDGQQKPWQPYYPDLTLRPGYTVTISGASYTKSLVINNLSITSANPKTDTVSGTADDGSLAWVYIPGTGANRHLNVDGTGIWTVDFSIPGPTDEEQVTYDIQAGMYIASRTADADGDYTRYGWQIPNLTIDFSGPVNVFISQEAVYDFSVTSEGESFPPGALATVDYVLYDADGELANSGPAASLGDGQYRISFNETLTGSLPAGFNRLEVNLDGSSWLLPYTYVFEFETVTTGQRYGGWLTEIIGVEETSNEEAIRRLQAGEIDIYGNNMADRDLFQTVQAANDLSYTNTYGTFNEITFNPIGPIFDGTGKFNPFASAKIREAVNWLIDRDYIADELTGGMTVPRYFAFSPFFNEYARYADLAAQTEATYAYDFAKAKAVIDAEMLALGAVKVNGRWQYNGEDIVLIGLIRVEDERTQIGDYFADQLEALGFVVDRQYKRSSEAGLIWQGDPKTGQWNWYTGGWITTSVPRTEEGSFIDFYAPEGWPGNPLWESYVNDPEFHDAALQLYTRDYSSIEERNDLFAYLIPASLQEAQRVWTTNRVTFIPYRNELTFTANLAGGLTGSGMWSHTIRKVNDEGGIATIAMTDLLNSIWNPVGGSNWVYDLAFIAATSDNGTISDPWTGLQLAQRVESADVIIRTGLPVTSSLDWVDLQFSNQIDIPADAWAGWDDTNQVFQTAGSGMTAEVKTVVHYPANLFETIQWHDGSLLSLADFLMKMILSFRYDNLPGGFQAVKIVSTDPLVIETYLDIFHLDAETSVETWWPQYSGGPGSWHALAAGLQAEADEQLAFHNWRANELGVEMMSYIQGSSLGILEGYVEDDASSGYIPYAPTLGAYITSAEAVTRWENLLDWYGDHGHFWVGTGPYYLHTITMNPDTVTLRHNASYVDPADRWDTYALPEEADIRIEGPKNVVLGDSAVFDAIVTHAGQPYPLEEIASLTYVLYDPDGNIASSGEAIPFVEGRYRMTLNGDLTSTLAAGFHTLEVTLHWISAPNPVTASFDFETVTSDPRRGGWATEIVITTVGSDTEAVSQLQNDENDVYAGGIRDLDLLNVVEADPNLDYASYATLYYELTFNPSGPMFYDGRLNPFGNPVIREAVNKLVDRDYIVNDILSGLGVPKYVPLSYTSADYTRYADAIQAIADEYAYNWAAAKQVIDAEMTAMGAVLVGGKWYFNDQPVTLIFLIRVEDKRFDIGNYVADQLESIGFTVDRQNKRSSEAAPIWLQSDPAEGQWHLYTAGWVTTSVSRDDSWDFQYFYTSDGSPGNPLWDAYNPISGLYDAALQLATMDFTSMEERETLFTTALELAMQDSVRVWLVDSKSFSPMQANIQGIVDRAGGLPYSQALAYTLRYEDQEGGLIRWKQPDVLAGPWNPIGGSTWLYDTTPINATSDRGTIPDPDTGLALPQRIEGADVIALTGLPMTSTLDWVTLQFADQIDVPADAWVGWDEANQIFQTAGDGITAKVKTVVYYPSNLFDTIQWHDGSPLSMADFAMKMILSFRYNDLPGGILAVKIVSTDPLVIETYLDGYQLDAENTVVTWWPQYNTGPGAWHTLAAGIQGEADGRLSFFDEPDIEWVSYAYGPSLGILQDYVVDDISSGYIPFAPTLGAYITNAEAVTRWENLLDWYGNHGNFWVGTGPYYLHKVSDTDKTLVLRHNANFVDLSSKWVDYFASGSVSATIGSSGGSLATQDGAVEMDIPASALTENITFTVTDTGSGYEVAYYDGIVLVFNSYTIEPHGTTFNQPVTITFRWLDEDNDGIVDGTTQPEAYLLIFKDGVAYTPPCLENADCNMAGNYLSITVTSLSLFELATWINQPPVADAGGPYTVVSGASITLDGSGSTDPDGDLLTYEWDLDNDGVYDDASGIVPTVTFNQDGEHIISLRVTNEGGLSDIDTATVTVLPWTLSGFYQPVDMNNIYNLVKGGSTVPMKFEIFAGATELTNIASIKSFTYAETACNVNVTTDEIEMTSAGGTLLRYDETAGQFIYNWKTPKTAGKCLRVTLTTLDGSSLAAFFKLK